MLKVKRLMIRIHVTVLEIAQARKVKNIRINVTVLKNFQSKTLNIVIVISFKQKYKKYFKLNKQCKQ